MAVGASLALIELPRDGHHIRCGRLPQLGLRRPPAACPPATTGVVERTNQWVGSIDETPTAADQPARRRSGSGAPVRAVGGRPRWYRRRRSVTADRQRPAINRGPPVARVLPSTPGGTRPCRLATGAILLIRRSSSGVHGIQRRPDFPALQDSPSMGPGLCMKIHSKLLPTWRPDEPRATVPRSQRSTASGLPECR